MNECTYRKLAEYNKLLKAIDDAYRNVAKIFGLPECAFWILYTLRVEKHPMTQSEISSLQYQPKQTVNSALKKMDAEGYINLAYGDDQRSKYICLTEKGIRLAEKTVDKVADAETRALIGLSDDEQKKFINLLGKYSHLLTQEIQGLNTGQEDDA